MADEQQGPERHINIHFEPKHMAGKYANFANVSHSDYEFTLTFARVDHEVEDDEIPGVVVSRVNLSARFMRELIDAMEDNFSKWQTREGIRELPEFGPGPGESEEVPGVVVSRVSVSPRFMRELIDAMEDNFSKWQTTEGIKNLPEFGDEDDR